MTDGSSSLVPRPSSPGPQPAPYVDRYVEVGGLRLHYQDFGTAGKPALMCLHGGAAHGHWFDFVAPGFTADHHVLALDQRGHGDSAWADPPAYSYLDYAADLDQVAAKLDLRDFTLIGHSMGGMVAMVYAASYPGRMKRLVVVDTSINLPQERLSAMREVGNRGGSSYPSKEALVARYKLRPGNSLAPLERQHYIGGHSARQFPDGGWRHKFDRGVYALREQMDGMPCWDRIKVPALLVRGERSPRITPEVYAAVRARAPQVELVTVADSDHHVTLDNPEGFVRAVRPFLMADGGRRMAEG
jgi:pimeloyl-ACP methyl ester carboxylesterase